MFPLTGPDVWQDLVAEENPADGCQNADGECGYVGSIQPCRDGEFVLALLDVRVCWLACLEGWSRGLLGLRHVDRVIDRAAGSKVGNNADEEFESCG